MAHKTDGGGYATKCDDIKISHGSSTWATRLSQLAKSKGKLIIMTYGFQVRENEYSSEQIEDERSYIRGIFDKRPNDIFIICNSDSIEDAKRIKKLYPNIRIKHNSKIHANVALLEPNSVIFSSAEFGYSKYDELGVFLHSQDILEHLMDFFRKHWKNAEEITLEE